MLIDASVARAIARSDMPSIRSRRILARSDTVSLFMFKMIHESSIRVKGFMVEHE